MVDWRAAVSGVKTDARGGLTCAGESCTSTSSWSVSMGGRLACLVPGVMRGVTDGKEGALTVGLGGT